MERLTRAGLGRLTAALTEHLGDPTGPPETDRPSGHYSLRRSVAHALRGVEAYLEHAEHGSDLAGAAASRAQAEELWTVLEQAAAMLRQTGPPPSGSHARPDQQRKDRPMTPTTPAGAEANPPEPRATLTSTRQGATLILRPAGELDLDSADLLRPDPAALEGISDIAIDLSRLAFCDSTGLNALLQLRLDATARAVEVHLCAVREPVRRLLQITGTDQVFPLHDRVEDLLAAGDPTGNQPAD